MKLNSENEEPAMEINLFFRSGAIEGSNSSIEQGDINGLRQITEFLRGHGEERK